MRSLKLALIAVGLITIVFTSCKKSSNSKPSSANTITLKFNGTTYTTSNITAADSAGYFELIGVISNTSNINLYINGGFKVGSFDLASNKGTVNFATGPTSLFQSTDGTITITSLTSTTVSGTFSFTASNLLTGGTGTGTDGTFTTTYTTKH